MRTSQYMKAGLLGNTWVRRPTSRRRRWGWGVHNVRPMCAVLGRSRVWSVRSPDSANTLMWTEPAVSQRAVTFLMCDDILSTRQEQSQLKRQRIYWVYTWRGGALPDVVTLPAGHRDDSLGRSISLVIYVQAHLPPVPGRNRCLREGTVFRRSRSKVVQGHGLCHPGSLDGCVVTDDVLATRQRAKSP